MRTKAFALRNYKEIVRDKLNIAFGLGFPIIVLLLLSLIQSNIPVSLFEINKLSPEIAVFGLSFIPLFSGMLIAKDRISSFMLRLFTSLLTAGNFILGYTIPLFPLAIAQISVCFIAAIFLGLEVSINILPTIAVLIPAALLFIAIELLCGSVFTGRQVGGVCGTLPFMHAVNAVRAAHTGNFPDIFPYLRWVIGYSLILIVLAVIVFIRKMNSDSTN